MISVFLSVGLLIAIQKAASESEKYCRTSVSTDVSGPLNFTAVETMKEYMFFI